MEHPDSTLRMTITLSKISNALFLLADHILWLGRVDLCTLNTDQWSSISNKYWLCSITMNLVRDFYEILQLLKAEKNQIITKEGCKNLNDIFQMSRRALMCIQKSRAIMVDTVKNICDIFIPMTALGHVKLSPGTVGLLGVISSIAGLMALIEPLAKLTPA